MKITRWSPDTCGCIIEYQWDETVPTDKIVHSLSKVIAKCPAHKDLADAELWTTLIDENPRKNKGLQVALDHIPGLTVDDVDWSYNGSRILMLNIPSGKSTVPQINAIIGLMTATFGPGKVEVNRV